MSRNLEIIFDENPSGGCGCNCGCSGKSVVDDINQLVDDLKAYQFDVDINVSSSSIQSFDNSILISKLNLMLDKTNANFRVNNENLEETLSNILPIVVFNDEILTTYGVPTRNDVVMEVSKVL